MEVRKSELITKTRALQILRRQLTKADELSQDERSSSELSRWRAGTENALRMIFPNNLEHADAWGSFKFNFGLTKEDRARYFQLEISRSKRLLQLLIDHIEDFWEDTALDMSQTKSIQTDSKDVFVIHGRQKLDEFHHFIRALGLKPIEWSQARTLTGLATPMTWQIVDTALKRAAAIVVLLTADDEARLAPELWEEHESPLEKDFMKQPRQNVLFEAGVAYGRSPERTVMLRIGHSLRPISDLAGHHILNLSNDPTSRQQAADALRNAGCPVDITGTDWMRAGDLS